MPDSGAVEDFRKLLAVAVRHLGGAVQFQHVARGVVAGDGAAGLQRHRRMAADRDVDFDHGVRSAERGVDVAVALLDDHRLGREPVDLDRVVVGRHHRRQFVELEHHVLGGVLGAIGIVGEHHRHRLADITHAAARQQRLAVRHQLLDPVVAEVDRRHVGDVLAGPDRDHARRGAARRRRRPP